MARNFGKSETNPCFKVQLLNGSVRRCSLECGTLYYTVCLLLLLECCLKIQLFHDIPTMTVQLSTSYAQIHKLFEHGFPIPLKSS